LAQAVSAPGFSRSRSSQRVSPPPPPVEASVDKLAGATAAAGSMSAAAVVGLAKKKNKISGQLQSQRGHSKTRSDRWPEQEAAPLLAGARDAASSGPGLEPQERMCQLLEDWSRKQRAMHAEQQQLIDHLLSAQREALQELRCLQSQGGTPRFFDAAFTPTGSPTTAPVPSAPRSGQEGPASTAEDGDAVENRMARQMALYGRQEEMLDFWKRTHGMHTVDSWVMDYRKHPAGWGALLMIHGVGEMTSRLRSKVENYAIYSALFLSMSIALVADPADFIFNDCENLICEVQKRIYFYGLSIGTALHMLCIMLGMSFVNALNETARDADVYRLLSKGQGFFATRRCSLCFMIGCAADFLAVGVTAIEYLDPIEPLVLYVVLLFVACAIFFPTARRLFESSSIVSYWREELGGKPDPDDPYDLQVPAKCVHERASMNNLVFRSTSPVPPE